MKSARRFLPLLLVLFALGCQRPQLPTLPLDQLASSIEHKARHDLASVQAFSAAGRVKIQSKKGSGSTDFLMLYHPDHGLRVEIVDPLYRPMMIVLLKGPTLYIHDPKTGKTSVASRNELFSQLLGLGVPSPDLLPLVLGKIPPGDVVASHNPSCSTQDDRACFTLRDQAGILHGDVEVDLQTGHVASVTLPLPLSAQRAVRAEYFGHHSSGLAEKVKISYLKTQEFVIIRYSDIVHSKPIQIFLFDPDKLDAK